MKEVRTIRKKVYVVKLRATNDASGNPRRAWILYDAAGKYLGAVDEGYSGNAELRRVAPNYIELASIPVQPSTYNNLRKDFIYRR